jgi:hypothetical protein
MLDEESSLMKHTHLSVFLCFAVSALLWGQVSVPISNWYSLGLEDQKVSCIVSDDTSTILAGTDNGVAVRFAGKWFRANGVSMPVSAMVRISSAKVIAAMGNGSKSDGLYIGTKIRGEPYFEFALLCYITEPQALTVTGTRRDTVYAGTKDALYRCVLTDVSTDVKAQPEIIKIPPYAFGVEMPSCNAIEVMSGLLFAGGCDRSPNPGPGHVLVNGKDSMMILRQMNVSAMAAATGVIVRPQSVSNPATLAIGTNDSGIFIYRYIQIAESPVRDWTRFDSPKNEPVRHILPIPLVVVPTETVSPGIGDDVFLIAAPSGVFLGRNGNWTAVGAIPARPGYLAMYGNSYDSYLAGTEKGVFRYGPLATGLQQTAGKAFPAAISVGKGDRGLVIILNREDRITIRLHDLTGRLVWKTDGMCMKAGVNSVDLPMNYGHNPFIVSISGTNGAVGCLRIFGK